MSRKNTNRAIAAAVTVVVHVVVVVLLIKMALTTPLPLPGEAGVEVDLGMYNQGQGAVQMPKPKKVPETQSIQPEPEKEHTVTQDTEEAPALETPKPKEEPKVNQRALFKPSQNKEQTSSQGETETEGDQGNTNGTNDLRQYDGQGGSGGGPSYDLGGRGAKSLPKPGSNYQEEGKVVIDIWVDRDGRVVKAQVGKGTNISNMQMREAARQSALSSVFLPDRNAAEMQKGTITYNFVITQ